MKRRRTAAILAWVVPLVPVVGAAALPSDVDFSAPPILVHQAPSTNTTTTEVHPRSPAVTAPASPPRLIERFAPPPEQATSAVAAHSPVAGTQPTVADVAAPPSSEPSATDDAKAVAQQADEYVLDIPFIELSQPVVSGDQTEIDEGKVTAVDWTAYGYPASCLPGDGCTVWLAGHRTTHGAVFARLPELTIGVPIVIHFHGRLYSYSVTSVVTVPGSAPPSVISGDLVLQTSAPGDQRILIHADEV